ncbi:VOC family protein [Leifsonia sp. Leaf264]|uniref:VOC family protein n=1 Tax=Leifsonia sp. Leaf264 TaxID=1736314 RepID=UPI0006F49024|nr:VOC family protein [Leifsonia sp. Leaf264]KQO96640.1 glyoxalase [Leifsonia sp. Leaf264]
MVIVNDAREYPPGVPSWIDVSTPHPYDAMEFYGTLFGWRFHDAVPPGAPGAYLVATLDGHDVAAISPTDDLDSAVWHSYIAARSADTAVEAVIVAGGAVRTSPVDAGPGGRWAEFADPDGAVFRVWQARRRLGAQLVNEPGTWNFSVLITPRPESAIGFYTDVFGWQVDADLGAGMVRLPGYGDHLANTIDPDIRERQAFAPPGFADVVAGIEQGEAPARWEVRFTVEDRDAAAALAESAGGTVLSSDEGPWTREALIRDPHGALFTVSQFAPTGG